MPSGLCCGKMLAARAIQKRREHKAEERAGSIKAAKAATAAEMKERVGQVMASFDADKDGVLSKDEIAALVKSMAEAQGSEMLSEEALESIILNCTGARDGTVPETECGGLIKTAEQRGQVPPWWCHSLPPAAWDAKLRS